MIRSEDLHPWIVDRASHPATVRKAARLPERGLPRRGVTVQAQVGERG